MTDFLTRSARLRIQSSPQSTPGSEETARAFAAKHNMAKWHTDHEAFLNDPEVDVVYVASPNSLHYQWSLDALEAGKGVICEKPFVATLSEAETLRDLAREKGLFLVEAITVPHLPNFQLLRDQLAKISPIRLVQLNFSQYSSRHKAFLEGKNPNVFSGVRGRSFNGHQLLQSAFHAGPFWQATGALLPPISRKTASIPPVLILKYPEFIAEAVGAKDSRSENMAQIQGEKGYILVSNETSRCVSVKVVSPIGEETFNEQPEDNVLVYEMREFAEIYRTKDVAKRDRLMDMTCRAMKWLERARKDGGVFFEGEK